VIIRVAPEQRGKPEALVGEACGERDCDAEVPNLAGRRDDGEQHLAAVDRVSGDGGEIPARFVSPWPAALMIGSTEGYSTA
jgi:hypothetical protein